MLRRALILAAHLVAILTPMALGWGPGNLPGFFAVPARSGLLLPIALGALAVLLLGIDLDPLRAGTRAPVAESRRLLALTASAIALLAFLPYADRRHLFTFARPQVRWLGLALCAAAGTVRILALRELGPQFSAYVTLQPHHELVQSGIYSLIRHPLYLSLLLAGPGVALVFASQLVWPILAAAVVFTVDRIRAEEVLLAKTFQGSFPRYRDRTSALLPFVF